MMRTQHHKKSPIPQQQSHMAHTQMH